MFTGRCQGRLTSPRAPRTWKETGGPPSLPAKEHSWGRRQDWGYTRTRKCSHHTPPPHLNTISQDVETISILEGEKRGWPTDSVAWIGPLQDCRSGLCGWGAVWSLLPMDAGHSFISILGVGLEEGLLPSFLLHLCCFSLTESCPQA